MRIAAAFILCLVMLTSVAYAQGDPSAAPAPPTTPAPGMPGMPAMPGMSAGARGMKTISVGPADSKGLPRKLNGKVSVLGIVPRSVTPLTEVEVYVDGNIIGRADQAPYRVEFDTATVADGEHLIKAVGKNTEGKEAWSATVKTLINNSGKPDAPGVPGAAKNPRPNSGPSNAPIPAPNAAPTPGTQEAPPAEPATEPTAQPAAVENPTAVQNEEPVLPAVPMQVNQDPNAIQYELSKTFTTSKYRFSLQYPGTWAVEDATAKMKPKFRGGFWFVLAEKPISKTNLVVNVRRMRLEPTTDADTFAKYNSYVNKWERKTVLDATAFATSGGSEASKRVVHRTIIIKNGSAWMFNCIDTSGKPASDSARLFESIINTLTIQ